MNLNAIECADSIKDIRPLSYSIYKYSSSSSSYIPENILENKPHDQASRWSSNSISPPQFLMLKLETVAILDSITFGKYQKTHVCNLKRFKIFGGMHEDNLVKILESGLKNDSSPESFSLRSVFGKRHFPCKLLKIVPIQSWGPIFNFSIWHVALKGSTVLDVVKAAIDDQRRLNEKEAIRLCLKHFRHHNYGDIYDSLQKRTKIRLESPLLTELHSALVLRGDFDKTEAIVTKAIQDGLFDSWINSQDPVPQWTLLSQPEYEEYSADSRRTEEINSSTPSQAPILLMHGGGHVTPSEEEYSLEDSVSDTEGHMEDGIELINVGRLPSSNISNESLPLISAASSPESAVPVKPVPRGGHKMVLDPCQQCIYLLGGWNGSEDLSDFWCFDLVTSKWTLLSIDVNQDGGPSPRSCHKMVLDSSSRHIFMLGRYLDRELRDDVGIIKSDLYMYNIDSQRWTLITDDTYSMGGPNLIFDHQMVLDEETKTIYVFGGQSLYSPALGLASLNDRFGPLLSDKKFSGLYSYHISTNTWKLLREDGLGSSEGEIRSRGCHAVLFHPRTRKLYIFGGQRKRGDFLYDFFTYDVDRNEISVIFNGNSPDSSIPAVGHTMRATIDNERDEIYVMTGMNKDMEKNYHKRSEELGFQHKVTNSFWVYNINSNMWTCFYKSDNSLSSAPSPRYAHQLVYNERTKTHYLFGGNPGGKEGKEDRVRLGDIWSLYLVRPSKEEIARKCKVMIRKIKFIELTDDRNTPQAAASYLQNELSEVINHKDPEEAKNFRLLASRLFQLDPSIENVDDIEDFLTDRRNHRLKLFDSLSEYFPDNMTQPKSNLVDLIRHDMDVD